MSDVQKLIDELRRRGRGGESGPSAMRFDCLNAADALEQQAAQIEALTKDATRYRWLRDHVCNSLSLSRDDDHACNYMTASAWIDANPDWFDDVDPAEVARMRETNTIWSLQVYPNTPGGFNVWHGATADSVIESAIKAQKEQP